MIKSFFENNRGVWRDGEFVLSVALSVLFLFFSFVINFFAGSYANSSQSNFVSDLLLDHLPFYNMNIVFFEGFFLFLMLTILVLAYKPKSIPFVLKSMALFILIRAIFITLTHIKDYPNQAFLEADSIFKDVFTFGGDLFFSAHTGMPFLLALVFWKDKGLRIVFLITSLFFGASVLLGHLHYSIDVFGAYFITYSIYEIARKFFAKDYVLFLK